jgi:hypothetical protein
MAQTHGSEWERHLTVRGTFISFGISMIAWLDYFHEDPKRLRWWHVRWRVWLVIPGCLAAVAMTFQLCSMRGFVPGLPKTAAMSNVLESFRFEMEAYYIDNGRYPGPTAADFLKACPDFDNPAGLDLWGHPLVYWVSPDGQHAIIYSCGPSGIDRHGAGDNIAIHCDIVPPTTATAPSTQPRWGN